jgi:flagellar biosynthesis chaperone FliJ
MGLLLVIAVIAWAFTRSISDARIDHTYAKQGLASPRLQAKYGGQAQAKTSRYGFTDYLADAWSDHWGRRGESLAAARAAWTPEPAGPKVSWRERWRSAKAAAVQVGHRLVDPVEAKPASVAPAAPESAPLVVETGDVPPGTVRIGEGGREQWDGAEWKPAPEPAAARPEPTAEPDTPPEPAAAAGVPRQPEASTPASAATAEPSKPQTPATGGPTMTTPTGEAVNYETTVAELEAQAAELRGHVDHCTQTLANVEAAKVSINNMQESYRTTQQAAATTADHLSAMNLDATTQAHAGTVVDAMPAGKVDEMYDHLEQIEEMAKERKRDAEVALASVEAELSHVQATYGDAHATVAGNLSGDASFLHSGGGSLAPADGQLPASAVAAYYPRHGESLSEQMTGRGGSPSATQGAPAAQPRENVSA